MDIPHFVKNVETQSRYKIVGPILWQPDVSGSELGEYPQSGNVYVTLGGSGKSSYLKRILQALEHTGKFLILSGISDKLKQELLERHPFLEHKSIIRNLVNPEEFLHTCDLTICHGGSGTVYQSLNRGVPVFCFPSHSDQQLVSYHAKQHGVCEYIYAPRPSLANVKNILMKMLHKDSYKKNAILFADKIKTCDTASNWLNLLCEIEEKTARSSKAMPSIVLRQESYKSRSGVSLVLDN